MKLQYPQETHGLEHLRDEHLQAALKLDEEAADLRVDLSILWPALVTVGWSKKRKTPKSNVSEEETTT